MPKENEVDPARRSLLAAAPVASLLASMGAAGFAGAAAAATGQNNRVFSAHEEKVRPNDFRATSKLANLLGAMPGGSVLFFEPGDYDLSGWSPVKIGKTLTLLAYPGTVTLRGPGVAPALGKRGGGNFIVITIGDQAESRAATRPKPEDPVSLTVDGLRFVNWGRTIATIHDQPIESLTVRNCSFRSVQSGVDAYGGRPGGDGIIRRVLIENCDAEDCVKPALWVRAMFDSALVTGNRVTKCSSSAISVGSTSPPYTDDPSRWKKAVISNNVCTDLVSSGKASDVHGVIAGGREISINQNHIQNVRNGGGTGAEGIYTKALYSEVCHNTLVDAGEREAAITMKGARGGKLMAARPSGYGNRICNNTILGPRRNKPLGRGITTFMGDVLIANNYFENLTGAIRVGGPAEEGGVLITGNMMKGISDMAIVYAGSASNVSVIGNTISLRPNGNNQDGILMRRRKGHAGDEVEDWVIKDNLIRAEDSKRPMKRGISIVCEKEERLQLDGLVIANNHLSHLNFGIWSKASHMPVIEKDGAWIHGNYFNSCRQDVASALLDDPKHIIVENNRRRRRRSKDS